jgi:hypothetical protein
MNRAVVLPVRVKPTLMRLPWPIWKRAVYPLWLRWYKLWLRLPLWQEGAWKPGDTAYWRGVRLVCCQGHYAGPAADHPWDPGAGWSEWKAAAMWEPARRRDRTLLSIVGDPRRRASRVEGNG